MKFDSMKSYQSMFKFLYIIFSINLFNSPDATIDYAPLQLVQIYFDTATYDQIERDVKMTVTGQIGLIGGTMGLLTGFSILSGVEILYFAAKLFMSTRTPKGLRAGRKN